MTRFLRFALLLSLLAAPSPAADEAPPQVTAAGLLGARAVGPHHRVADPIDASGYYFRFDLRTDYGDLAVEGLTQLDERLREVEALARLDEISKGQVFAQAAGGAIVRIGQGVVHLARNPVDTARGVGSGLKRFAVNLGRKAKRAAVDVHDAATTTDEERARAIERGAPVDERTDAEKASAAAGAVARGVFGVNAAARRWAQRLGVDPYTTNPVLRQALIDFGEVDAAGGILAKVALPIPALATTTADVNALVWGADPEEVRKQNEARARELGLAPELASALWRADAFTLTLQTRLIAALHAVNPTGAASFVEAAHDAVDEREALYFIEAAEMLRRIDGEMPTAELLTDTRSLVARSGGVALVVLPVDHVRWSERFAEQARELAGRARKELRARRLEMRVSGSVSAQARRELAALGYLVREGEPLS